MNAKKVLTIALTAFVLVSIVWLVVREVSPKRTGADATPAAAGRQVMVYYFHRTARCPTCLKIEALAKQEVEASFAAELKQGDLKFQSLNVEEAGNEHFVKDYDLVSQSLVLVDYRNGVPGRWKSLDAVWDLVHAEEDFARYVRDEVQAFVGST
jgi:hypothetical protein